MLAAKKKVVVDRFDRTPCMGHILYRNVWVQIHLQVLGWRKLKDNRNVVSDFKQNKLEKEAQKNWDLFYKRNTTNVFKDRHWTTAEII